MIENKTLPEALAHLRSLKVRKNEHEELLVQQKDAVSVTVDLLMACDRAITDQCELCEQLFYQALKSTPDEDPKDNA